MIETPIIIQDGRFRIHLDGTIERRPKHHADQWEIAPKVHWSAKDKDFDAWVITDTNANGDQDSHYAHRLYAEAFVDNPNPERYTIVMPKDKNRKNLNPDNLMWTDNEHITHARLEGLIQWYADHAAPCKRCERPFVTTVNHNCCTTCRTLNEVEANTKARHQRRVQPLDVLDLSIFPERTQNYLRLRRQGKTYQEIADVYGVSRQAVNANIRNAMKKYKNVDYRMYKEKSS